MLLALDTNKLYEIVKDWQIVLQNIHINKSTFSSKEAAIKTYGHIANIEGLLSRNEMELQMTDNTYSHHKIKSNNT